MSSYKLKNSKDTLSVAGYPNITSKNIDDELVELILKNYPIMAQHFTKDGLDIKSVKVEKGKPIHVTLEAPEKDEPKSKKSKDVSAPEETI